MDVDIRHPELVEKIPNLLDEDLHAFPKTIRAEFRVGEGTLHRIIHEVMNLHQICAKLVPEVLFDE